MNTAAHSGLAWGVFAVFAVFADDVQHALVPVLLTLAVVWAWLAVLPLTRG